VLSRLFRGKYLDGLRKLLEAGKLTLPQKFQGLAHSKGLARWLSRLYRKEWVIYSKRPFGGPGQVLKYLARYTHRVAISNSRLIDVSNGRVTFRYKDYADGNKQKVTTLSADEFLRRFTQHVLPKKFVKIRHYGLLANKQREHKLELSRLLLNAEEAPQGSDERTPPEAIIKEAEPVRCENCGSTRLVTLQLQRIRPRSVAIAQLGRSDSG